MSLPAVPKEIKEAAKNLCCKIYVGKSKLLVKIEGGDSQIREVFAKAYAHSLSQVSKYLGLQKVEIIAGDTQ